MEGQVVPRLEEVVAKALDAPAAEITDASSPYTLPQWTSMRHLGVIIEIESAYQIRFSPSELVSLTSVDRIRTALRAKGLPV